MITKFYIFERLRDTDYDSKFFPKSIYMDEDRTDPRLNKFKFKLGDYVSFSKSKSKSNKIFQIIAIDPNIDQNSFYVDSAYRIKNLESEELFWSNAKELRLLQDYEVAALKYNL